MKSQFAHKTTCCFLLLAVFICNYTVAQIKTVVPANNINSINPSTTQSVDIAFNLNTLPANCKITACELQLTCEKPVIELSPQLNVLSADNRQIDNYALKPSQTFRGAVISLKISNAFLPSPGNTNYVLKLKLNHTIQTSASFFPATGRFEAEQGYAPRLIVSYTFDAAEKPLPVTDWASVYSNYQHTSQIPIAIKGAIPQNFEKTDIGGMGDLPQNLVLYRDHIYVVGDNGPSLYAVDLATLKATAISPTLSGDRTRSTPVIDPFGHFYHAAANNFAVTDLANNQYSGNKTASGRIANALTTGPDGSLYIPCDNSISAYTPFPQNTLTWDIYRSGKKSAIALNKAGTIAYVLIYNNGKTANLLALNANTGKVIKESQIALDDQPGEDEFLPTPVVDDNGYVYLANRVIGARHLYILNAGLTEFKQQIAGRVSMPAAMINDHLKITGMFYIKRDSLFKYDSDSLKLTHLLKVEGDSLQPMRSFLSDQRNGIYYTRLGNSAFYYKPATANTFSRADLGVNFEKNLVIGADGNLYTGTGGGIVVIRASSYSGDYELKTIGDDQNRNNLSFIGNGLTIQSGFTFSNYKYLKAINSIIIKNKVTLTKNADVLLKINKNGSCISFGNEFTVAKGAVLQIKTVN